MLENLALQYTELPEDQMQALGYGLMIMGGIIGGLTNKSAFEIRRGHYFSLSGLIFLCVSVATFIGMTFIVQSLVGGFFWLVVALEILTSVVAGFFIARIAAARSRDAYGHGRMATLAFIPIANLWLLFTPSKNDIFANMFPEIPLFSRGLGVISGFVFLIAGIALSAYAQEDGARRIQAASAAGAFNAAALDRILTTIAAEVQTPVRIDEVTTLQSLEANGTELRYVYEVDRPEDFLSASFRTEVLQGNCNYDGLAGVIDAGAVVTHLYLRKGGEEIGTIEVSRQLCGR